MSNQVNQKNPYSGRNSNDRPPETTPIATFYPDFSMLYVHDKALTRRILGEFDRLVSENPETYQKNGGEKQE